MEKERIKHILTVWGLLSVGIGLIMLVHYKYLYTNYSALDIVKIFGGLFILVVILERGKK